MVSLQQVMDDHGALDPADQAWLRGVVNEWHILADTSFSDLVLWIPDRDDPAVFWAGAQIRPTTGPTALEEDVIDEFISYDDEHAVTSAWLTGEIVETSNNQLNAGIPVDTWAVPIVRHGSVIAVLERHTNRMGVRAPGALEDSFLHVADLLTDMLHLGEFPVQPPSEPNLSPRVADGLVVLESAGVVRYATPNAITAFRRLGFAGDLEGERLRDIVRSLELSRAEVGQSINGDLNADAVNEVDLDNRRASARMRIMPLHLEGLRVATLVLLRDTTEIRDRERQLVTKDATIREIHHRVKNNLQTVAALLRLQSRRMTTEESRSALQDAMNRVASIAVVHEILSQAHAEAVEFDDIADRILRMVGDVAAFQGQVAAVREGSFGLVPAAAATSLSLVMTELCQNAVEHGLGSGAGRVVVRPRNVEQVLTVDVLDEGPGLPEGFRLGATTSLGLSIVSTLVADAGGTFTLDNRADVEPGTHGTRARVTIPLQAT